jgi:hypothetical protein|tara:strand:+ start:271 stop:492 length:222 start_codon:yes stop_codon:yes gene_type:complete
MTTNVHKSFEGPSDFEGMFTGAAQKTSDTFAGQQKTENGGRWSAVRNHCIDQANEKANKPAPAPVYRGGIRLH